MAEQGAMMSWMVRDDALSGSPTMVNTGSGVPIQSTDGQVCTDGASSRAVCTGSQVLLPRIKLGAVRVGNQVVLPRITACAGRLWSAG